MERKVPESFMIGDYKVFPTDPLYDYSSYKLYKATGRGDKLLKVKVYNKTFVEANKHLVFEELVVLHELKRLYTDPTLASDPWNFLPKVYDIFQSAKNLYIFFDGNNSSGKEITSNPDTAEPVIEDVLLAMKKLSELGIVHTNLTWNSLAIKPSTKNNDKQYVVEDTHNMVRTKCTDRLNFDRTVASERDHIIGNPSKIDAGKENAWSVGALLYELLEGKPLDINGKDLWEGDEFVKKLAIYEYEDSPLNRFIAKALHKDPAHRSSVDELCKEEYVLYTIKIPYKPIYGSEVKHISKGGQGYVTMVKIKDRSVRARKRIEKDGENITPWVKKEIMAYQKLGEHAKHVINMLDYYQSDWNYYLEYTLAYSDLEKELKEIREQNGSKNLSLYKIKQIALQVAKGIEEMHDKDIMHRDIKPANILLLKDEYERIKYTIGDLGIAKYATKAETKAGTSYYEAPEVAKGVYTKSVDIYSYGKVLEELVFKNEGIMATRFKGTKDYYGLNDLILRCIEADPAKRYDIKAVLAHNFLQVGIEKLKENPYTFFNTKSIGKRTVHFGKECIVEEFEPLEYIEKVLLEECTILQRLNFLPRKEEDAFVAEFKGCYNYKGKYYLVLNGCTKFASQMIPSELTLKNIKKIGECIKKAIQTAHNALNEDFLKKQEWDTRPDKGLPSLKPIYHGDIRPENIMLIINGLVVERAMLCSFRTSCKSQERKKDKKLSQDEKNRRDIELYGRTMLKLYNNLEELPDKIPVEMIKSILDKKGVKEERTYKILNRCFTMNKEGRSSIEEVFG